MFGKDTQRDYMRVPERFHIDSVTKPDGVLWFTFVYENPKSYYIECYNDSPQPFIKDRLTIIKPADFKKHEVKGVSLNRLLQTKLIEIGIERRNELRKAIEQVPANISPIT